jgi:hypothetical protein
MDYGLPKQALYGELFHMYGIQEMTSETVFLVPRICAAPVFLRFLHRLNRDALRNPAFDPTFHTLAPLNCATSELASVPRYCSART